MTIPVALSPCPNDTFAICALAEGHLPTRRPWAFEFHDIDTLNQLAIAKAPGIYKISAGTYGRLQGYTLLECGMAVTQDAGPLIVTSAQAKLIDPSEWILAIPGEGTTAAWLAERLAPKPKKRIVLRYDQILPAICEAKVDAGVLIHEARFTYEKFGLILAYDLGKAWQKLNQMPLVLSCLVASGDLSQEIYRDFVLDFRASLEWARQNRDSAWPFIEAKAQEKDPSVIQAHIEHFVGPITHTAPLKILQLLESTYREAPGHFCNAR